MLRNSRVSKELKGLCTEHKVEVEQIIAIQPNPFSNSIKRNIKTEQLKNEANTAMEFVEQWDPIRKSGDVKGGQSSNSVIEKWNGGGREEWRMNREKPNKTLNVFNLNFPKK